MSIEIKDVSKNFGTFAALKSINLEVKNGELIALLGPSGSGKTTLLRIIAGLENLDQGSVFFHGEDARGQKVRDRKVGFVFQHYALFRHMTVFDNVAFGLKVKPRADRPSKDEIRKKVVKLLQLVQLDRMLERFPSQLSGGQRQRVALARALAIEPKVLLLDEPFGALDAKVRKELRTWLRRLHDEIHVTSVFVTHDVEEALEVADRVVVMNEGRIEQMGTPEEVYHSPVNSFVYNFIGSVNLFHGRVEDGKVQLAAMNNPLPGDGNEETKTARVYVRPHLLEISREAAAEGSFRAQVKYLNPAGPYVKVELSSEWGGMVEAHISHERYRALALKKDDRVFVRMKDDKAFFADYSI